MIDCDDKEYRVFKTDFFHRIGSNKAKTLLIVWAPAISAMTIFSVIYATISELSWHIPVLLFLGWFLWTFIEYLIHRFVFHPPPKRKRWSKNLIAKGHAIHHRNFRCLPHLPLLFSLPGAVVFYFAGYLLLIVMLKLSFAHLNLFFSGMAIGFGVFEIMHDIAHSAAKGKKLKKGLLGIFQRNHLRHHGEGLCPVNRFSFTNPLWDYVFGTMPKSGMHTGN